MVLTGAGVSQESGIDTFRDAGGLWSQVRIEDVATPDAFARDPGRVQAFYNARRQRLLGGAVAPNAAHLALAHLERDWPGAVLIVTQNIDDLHERAGTRNLIHMHGEMLKVRCTACAAVIAWRSGIGTSETCPACKKSASLRPHVVWFGEVPMELDRIYKALEDCRLFLSVGTSGSVYPAGDIVRHVRLLNRAHTVELNLEPSEGASHFAETIYGRASEIPPAYIDGLLAGALR